MKLSPFEKRILRNAHEERELIWGLSAGDIMSRYPGALVSLGRAGFLKGEELTDEGRAECAKLFNVNRNLWAYCHACGHKWVALVLPIPLSEAGKELNGNYDCGKCGAIGYLAPKEEKPK